MREMKINDIMVISTVHWKIIIKVKEIRDTEMRAFVLYDNEADGLSWTGQMIHFNTRDLEQSYKTEKITEGQALLEMLE